MLETLKREVCDANLKLVEYGLVILTWGNVSALSEDGKFVVIKPSGVDYSSMCPEQMVVTDLSGTVVEGELRPSSDLLTHLELYRSFAGVGAVVHTHLSPSEIGPHGHPRSVSMQAWSLLLGRQLQKSCGKCPYPGGNSPHGIDYDPVLPPGRASSPVSFG